MSRNVGRIDQYVRIVVGLALVAFAFQDGPSIRDGTGLVWPDSSCWRPPSSAAARFIACSEFRPVNAGSKALDPAWIDCCSARNRSRGAGFQFCRQVSTSLAVLSITRSLCFNSRSVSRRMKSS